MKRVHELSNTRERILLLYRMSSVLPARSPFERNPIIVGTSACFGM